MTTARVGGWVGLAAGVQILLCSVCLEVWEADVRAGDLSAGTNTR